MGADLLRIAKSGLFASKKSMATTSHNISNANTEGYSKQDVRTETGITINEGKYTVGTGVQVQSIRRAHDKLVERKLNHSLTADEYNDERVEQLGYLEEIFNEINSDGMGKVLNRFFNSFRELANQPENETVRSIVRENAKIVVDDFHRVQESLDHAKDSINHKVEIAVTDINKLASRIAELNVQIATFEVSGASANDLQDQRDLTVRTLSEYVPINTYEDEMGRFTVNAEGLGSLVSGEAIQELMVGNNTKDDADSNNKKDKEIYFKSRPSNPVSFKIRGGSLGAMLETRREEIRELEDKLNDMAVNLVRMTNTLHRRGYANHKVPTDEAGNPIMALADKQVTGINFFKEPLDPDRACEYIDISDSIKEDVNNIATAFEPNKSGDNRMAISISKLQHEPIMNGGTISFEEHYLKSVGKVALKSSKARIDKEQSGGIVAQVKSMKERLSGVSLDEEAANMVKYQNAYEANAKMIKAADEMFKAVLSLK